MQENDVRESANSFLRQAIQRLAEIPYAELAAWPEWPGTPPVDLAVPANLHQYTFAAMKDTRSDGSVRIVIQRYRKIFWRYGEMTADGFFAHPDGQIRWFTEKDIWEVT